MYPFEYQSAASMEDAFSKVSGSQGKGFYLAGGTDLLVQIKERRISPGVVVDLKTITEMQGIETAGDEIKVGALTTVRTLETSEIIREQLPLLAEAAGKLGSVQVRNRATVGGNLCNAAPSAETAPALLALEARAEIMGKSGTRTVELKEFFTGPGLTILVEGEILKTLRIPLSRSRQGAVYYKLSNRKAMDIAFVGVAVLIEVNGETIEKVRIALGAVAPTPLRVTAVEELLQGKIMNEELARQAAGIAAESCQPITDLRASAEYRREMVNNLCCQGLLEAYQRAIV